jgi:hypothetical protein
MEISDVRKRVLQAIDQSRRAVADRRVRVDAASAAYERFLVHVATPLFKQFANVLKAEGYPYQVFTPAGGLRLASDRAPEDFIELRLDVSGHSPVVLGHVNRGRGSRVMTSEHPIGAGVAELTESDVLEFLVQEIQPFVER